MRDGDVVLDGSGSALVSVQPKPKPAAKTFGKTFGSAPTKPRLALGDLTPSFSPKPLPPPKPLVVPQRPTHKVLAARSSINPLTRSIRTRDHS